MNCESDFEKAFTVTLSILIRFAPFLMIVGSWQPLKTKVSWQNPDTSWGQCCEVRKCPLICQRHVRPWRHLLQGNVQIPRMTALRRCVATSWVPNVSRLSCPSLQMFATDGFYMFSHVFAHFFTCFRIKSWSCESFRILFDMFGLGIYSKYLILLMFLLACPILEEQFLHGWSCWCTARDAEVTDRLRTQTWVTPGQHIWQHLTELQVSRKTSTGPLARPAALLVLILQTHQSMPHLGPARR